jgi:putative spermidine/putrescine transport system substrate-binding protein
MDVDCVLVPRGAPNKQLAMKVINEFVDAKNQAQIAKLIPIGPVNTNAFKTGILTEQEIAANNTAPANYKLQLLVDPAFYAGRLDKLQERYDALIQRNK